MEITREFAESVIAAVKSCKSIMMDSFTVSEKDGASNLVTTADTAVQSRLRTLLGEILTQAGFLGEESPDVTALGNIYWVVDPIDGTSNFARGMRLSAISVGLLEDEEEIFGVVYNPYAEELFCAAKGQGAYLNGERIRVSERDFSHSLIFTAFSLYQKAYAPLCESALAELYPECDDFRRLGSAALELCALAAGRGELYFEIRIFPWDWAAAAVIIREAGGTIGTIDGERLRHDAPVLLLAANSDENFRTLKRTVQKHIPKLPYRA